MISVPTSDKKNQYYIIPKCNEIFVLDAPLSYDHKHIFAEDSCKMKGDTLELLLMFYMNRWP